MLSRLRSGVVEDGTAIGNGLATAVNRLRESGAKSKVVILLTDGVNNRGQISPLMAAEIARDMGIKVYTIGVGTRGRAPYPAVDMFGNKTTVMADVEIDEELLREISSMTGGKYYRAVNDEALREIYAEINELETSKVQVTNYQTYEELFLMWVVLGLLCLGLEFLFDKVVLNRLP
jgi:Ca-activated chloride channel family protein